jgi:hypothetical protein
VIDLISLVNVERLDKALTTIFRDSNSILMGLAFKNDLTVLRKHLPQLEFPKSVANHCDAADLLSKMLIFEAKVSGTKTPLPVPAGTLRGIT